MVLASSGKTIDIWKQPWIPWLSYVEFQNLMESIRHRAYLESLNLNAGEKSLIWKLIWNPRIHFRIYILLWWTLSCCLPTRDKLCFLTDQSCHLCGAEKESTLHLFWDCPFARILWFSGPFAIGSSLDQASELSKILLHLADSLPSNDLFFKGCIVNALNTRTNLLLRFSEFVNASTDATKQYDGKARLGIGCFDCTLSSWSQFSKPVRANSAMEGDIHAILRALQICTSLKSKSIAIASDAQIVVNAFSKKLFPPCWEAKALVEDIRMLSSHFNVCNFAFIKREDNLATNNAAKMARINGPCNALDNRERSPIVIPSYLY
ncbi:hypothetical protein G4B88_010154 [Cannabis sativa]|uniref:RNase H type-1 domain-containing protein n=1 Tax=Cannabis sativa TaxID=3483 RepID=A0A7J6E8U5_CANSA|nr:hypothetical protein G4B88_010154 [Cannabis sativa]